MRGPSIRRTIAFSALLHMTFLALSVVLIGYSRNMVMPSPYMVTLVNPSSVRSSGARSTGVEEAKPAVRETSKPEPDNRRMAEKTSKAEEKMLDEKMAELSAKNRLKKSSELRRKMAEISGSGSSAKFGRKSSVKTGPAGGPPGSAGDVYMAKITAEIWEQFSWPDTGQKNLEAIILVKINRDGSIVVQGKEKSSGNILFDRLALKAIAKASPVSPPPFEMEIGIRFYP